MKEKCIIKFQDKNFTDFVPVHLISTVYGINKYNLPIAQSATFTAIMLTSEIIGFGIWGNLGDRIGYKRVFEISNLILILGIGSLLLVNTLWALYLVFALMSFAHSGENILDLSFYWRQSSAAAWSSSGDITACSWQLWSWRSLLLQ